MMPWKIINKENQNILSIRPIAKDLIFAAYNADLTKNDIPLLREIEQKIKDGESWAVITFEYDIKRTFRCEFSDDGHIFWIERSTIKYVYDGQTLESSPSVKVDTDKIINYLQDNSHHFIYKDDVSGESSVIIKLR